MAAKIIFNNKTIPEISKFIADNKSGCLYKFLGFSSTEKMLEKLDELKLGEKDVIVLGMMNEQNIMSAINTIPQIKSKHENVKIVVCLRGLEYISEVFESKPDYVLNISQLGERLLPLLKRFDENDCYSKNLLVIKKQGEAYCIDPEKVICFEKTVRKVKVFLDNGENLVFSGSLQNLLKSLPEYFVRAHTGFVINAKKILKVLETTVVLAGDPVMEIPTSRARRREVKSYLKKNRTGLN